MKSKGMRKRNATNHFIIYMNDGSYIVRLERTCELINDLLKREMKWKGQESYQRKKGQQRS